MGSIILGIFIAIISIGLLGAILGAVLSLASEKLKVEEDLSVITSYSIHYTKLYEYPCCNKSVKNLAPAKETLNTINPCVFRSSLCKGPGENERLSTVFCLRYRITSYNVCYTKLLR